MNFRVLKLRMEKRGYPGATHNQGIPLGLAPPQGERHRRGLSLLLLTTDLGLWLIAMALLGSLQWSGSAVTHRLCTRSLKGVRMSPVRLPAKPPAQELSAS